MGFGLFEGNLSVRGGGGLLLNEAAAFLTNRTGTAMTAGQLAQLDFGLDATETTSWQTGSSSSAYANVIPVDATGLQFYPIVAAAETVADNALGRFILRGVINTKIQKASGGVGIGDPLVGEASSLEFSADLTGGAKVIGIAQTAVADGDTSGSAGGDATVLFDGIDGFGVVNTTV